MNGVALFQHLRKVGVTLTTSGDRLRFASQRPLTAEMIDQIQAFKPALLVLAGFGPAEWEWFDERAGVMEFDGGMSREDAEDAALEYMAREIRAAGRGQAA